MADDDNWTPDVDTLIRELKVLREKGLGELRRLRPELPELHRAAEVIDPAQPSVEATLENAVSLIGGDYATMARYDFGLIEGTKIWPSSRRRRKAAEIFGVTAGHFRKEPEQRIIEQIALNIEERVASTTSSPVPAGERPQGLPSDGKLIISPRGRFSHLAHSISIHPVYRIVAPFAAAGIGFFGGSAVVNITTGDTTDNSSHISYYNNPADPAPQVSEGPVEIGWGPERDMFKEQSPAPYPAFNSIDNNSFYGDERGFATIKLASITEDGGWEHGVTASAGEKYSLRIFVNNACSGNFENIGPGIIQGAKLTVGQQRLDDSTVKIWARLDADNAKTVWDSVKISSDDPINVWIDSSTAEIFSNAQQYTRLGSEITTTGVTLGYEDFDGDIRPGYEYALYIYVDISVSN